MSDKSGNRLHLMYLPLLADLERAGRYSWGFTCLAHLYREICRAICPSPKKKGGCSLLLQSWAWYHMPFIQPRVQQDITFLLASRIWTSCTALTSFVVVVWHQTDRVQLQFGLWQPIPNEAHNLDKMHEIDMRGHNDTIWDEQHADWISIWKDRRKHVIFGEPIQGPLQHTPEYLQ
uniref:Serine/threonine protein phosphatase 7 long form isogeny n=1 Tax=Cajanus cajan TaxID=3821 RepID=A0A151RY35_CAJCA|nr:Serine/threonine protein phosphatase 7 long form isogeny [Cajanus cajan]